METKHQNLYNMAFQSYQRGRFRWASKVLLFTVPLTAVSIAACGSHALTSTIGVLLSVYAIYGLWSGQDIGRGVKIGLVTGLIAFSVPLIVELTIGCPSNQVGLMICGAVGVGSGMLASIFLNRFESLKPATVISTATTAVLLGAMGCLILGLSGALVVAAAVIASMFPVYIQVTMAQS